MPLLRNIVLVLAIILLLKGLWCSLVPNSAQKTVDWWLGMPTAIARQLGFVLIAVGVVLIGLAVWSMGNAVVATVAIAGTVCVLLGLVYLHPSALQTIGKSLGSAGKPLTLRLHGGAALVLAALLFAIYFGVFCG